MKRKYIFTFFIISLCVRNSMQAMNPLHEAIGQEDTARVSRLIESRADVNRRDNCGVTPLRLAVYKGNESIFQILLNHCADINERDNYGNTLLCFAVLKDQQAIVKLLLRYVPDLNIVSSQQIENEQQKRKLEDLTKQEYIRRLKLRYPMLWPWSLEEEQELSLLAPSLKWIEQEYIRSRSQLGYMYLPLKEELSKCTAVPSLHPRYLLEEEEEYLVRLVRCLVE